MQSFMFKAANTWGPTFQCSATGMLIFIFIFIFQIHTFSAGICHPSVFTTSSPFRLRLGRRLLDSQTMKRRI